MRVSSVPVAAALAALAPIILAQQGDTASLPSASQTAAPDLLANIEGVSPQQASAFSSAADSFYTSFISAPTITVIGLDLVNVVPGSVIRSIIATPSTLVPLPTTNFDLSSFATAPVTPFPDLPWETQIPTDVKSTIDSLRTSALYEAKTIAQSVLGISQDIASPTNTGAAPRLTGAPMAIVGAALGAGAIFL